MTKRAGRGGNQSAPLEDAEVRRKPGRQPKVGREQMLCLATDLFWQHGYEGVSLSDLKESLNVKTPTLYRSWASKAELYGDCVASYCERIQPFDTSPIDELGLTASSISMMLTHYIAALHQGGPDASCMVMTGMIAFRSGNELVANESRSRRVALQAALTELLTPHLGAANAEQAALLLTAFLSGLAVINSDNVDHDKIDRMIQNFAKALEKIFQH